MMTRRIADRSIAAIIAVVAWAATVPAAWACPSCNRAIEGDPAALAFYWSTLFMIAMPYLLVAGVGGGLAYVYWSAARNAAASLKSTTSMTWSAGGPEKEGGR